MLLSHYVICQKKNNNYDKESSLSCTFVAPNKDYSIILNNKSFIIYEKIQPG